MINSKGIVTIVKRDASTGEVIDTIVQDNVVTYIKLDRDITDSSITLAARLFISTRPRLPSVPVSGHFNANQSVRADDISGTPRFEFTPKTMTDSAFWTVTGRVSPPASGTRNITGAFLSAQTGSNPASASTVAYVVFTTPCPQADTEVLDIFYRVVLDDVITPGPNVFDWIHEDYIEYWWFSDITPTSGGGVDNYPSLISWSWSPNVGANRSLRGVAEFGSLPAVSNNVNDMVKSLSTSFSLAGNPGALLGSAQVGNNNGGPMAVLKLLRPGDSPIQSVFGKDSISDKPFIDSTNAATGTGSITPEGLSWTNPDLPHHYRINITNSGDVGVSEYQVQRRRTLGYLGNNWTSSFARPVSIRAQYGFSQISANSEVTNPQKGTQEVQHGQTLIDTSTVGFGQFFSNGYSLFGTYEYLGTDLDAYEFITMDPTGITVVDFSKDTYFNIDANSAIPLPVTDVRQVSHESDGTIWVACGATGLYRIERSGVRGPVSSIQNVLTPAAPCYAVRVNPRNDDIWAIIDGGLVQSTDGGTSFTTYNEGSDPQFLVTGYTGTGGTNWGGFTSLHIDPVSTDDRVVIGTPITPGSSITGRITFWSRAGSSPTSDALISNNSASGESVGYSLIGARHCHYSNDGRFYSKDNTKNNAIVAWDWMNATGTTITVNEPCTQQGLCVIKDQTGDDLIVGVEFVNGINHLVARTFAQLGTTGFTIDLGGHPLAGVDARGYSAAHAVEGPIAYLGKGLYLAYSDTSIENAGTDYDRSTGLHLNMFGDASEPLAGDFEFDVWETYGWDGANWVLGNPNSKPTHVASEALIDGLNLSFTDGTPSPSFVSTDYYVFGVYDGIMKDDATSFDYEVFVPFSQTANGTDFSPAVVPAVDLGSVVSEPVSWINVDDLASEQGSIGPLQSVTSAVGQSTQVLEGDFEVSFKMDILDDSGTSTNNAFGIAIVDEATALLTNASPVSSFNQHTLLFKDDGLEDQSNDRAIVSESGAIPFTLTAPFDRENDIYTIRRTGTLIEYLKNSVVFYTSASASVGNKTVKFFRNSSYGTVTDAVVSYTANQRLVSIGNGVSTGRADINFRRVPVSLADSQIDINLDGVPTVVLTDPYAVPVAGECVMLPNGRIRFNSTDAGKAITGNWIITKKLNLA